jgi:hypothetical protein
LFYGVHFEFGEGLPCTKEDTFHIPTDLLRDPPLF